MTVPAQQHGAHTTPSGSLVELYQEAIELIERAKQVQPRHLSEDVDAAERAVVRLRDELIERLRSERAPDTAARTRAALNNVNMALSLIVGVEYPAAGIQRTLLEQAGAALRDLLESGQLGDAG